MSSLTQSRISYSKEIIEHNIFVFFLTNILIYLKDFFDCFVIWMIFCNDASITCKSQSLQKISSNFSKDFNHMYVLNVII